MQTYKHLTDDQVKDLFLQVAQEHALRQSNKLQKAPVDLQKLCKERFPETQIGGTCSIKHCDDEQVHFEFTLNEPITGMNDVTFPIDARFSRKNNGGFKLYILLSHGGSIATSFIYESFQSEKYLSPAMIGRTQWKPFPPELLSLRWISRIIYTAQQVWDALHM